ncbi:MAG TPA: multicopper oxidase domain-containing protein [Panacibacter sp.]|nr:multicopper oxidase domain-containing protein [Panacibacter sp.]
MKIFSFILLVCIVSFAFMHKTNSDALTGKEITEKLLSYKREYSLSCGTGYTAFNGAAYNFTTGFLPGFLNYAEQGNAVTDAPYNTLWIPDTLSGTVFNLRVHDTAKQYLSGPSTSTLAFNNNSILGPTLIFKKGTTVQMHIQNDLTDTTTVHWHGIHLPAIMDGGPHQPIAPGATWNPTWLVSNNASTFWYHPHLHMTTAKQSVMGLAGMIIVRDDAEAALNLPRTYGVDDIPLILNDKRFEAVTNKFVVSDFGDTMMCNGTLNAQYSVPAQVVRLRLLDAATDRSYNLGFSDNRSFSVISSDAGLLNNPVAVTRYILSPGERIEILVNLSGQQNQNVRLRAFNASMPTLIPGYEPNGPPTPIFLRNKLGARDFDILRLNIAAQTVNPVTAIPASLIVNSSLDSTKSSITRTILISQATGGCPAFSPGCAWFNGQFYDMDRIDYRVKKDSVEIWQLTNNSTIAHPFHIHDVSFLLLSKSSGPLEDYEKGWKDVVLVRTGTTVRFITKFNDYADSSHPYMYHCHISFHEDAGMMGQFTVDPPPQVTPSISINNVKSNEGNSGTRLMNFTVSLSNTSVNTVKVTYKTKDATAVSPSDYLAANGTLTFNPGETVKTIAITVNGDVTAEGSETFKINLSQPENAVLAIASGKGTIKNDDGSAALTANNNDAAVITEHTGISIYPNPVSTGNLYVELHPSINNTVHIKITDAVGKTVKVLSVNANTQKLSVDISSLKTGTYFLVLLNGKNNYRQQFQVMHSQ